MGFFSWDHPLNTLWAIRVSLNHLMRVGELRLMSAVHASIIGDILWLRGEGLDAELHRVLAPIADGPVFQVAADRRLTPFGAAVPIERLPEVDWKPLREILMPVLPSSQMAVVQLPRVRLRLERTMLEQEAALLVTDWPSFQEWALSAPEIRLRGCRFAVCRDALTALGNRTAPTHRVAIMGQPLPPIVGERFWLAGSIAIPLGFHWVPHVDVKTVEAVFARGVEDSASRIRVWNAEHNLLEETVSSEWVPLTRRSVRATDVVRTTTSQ